MRRTLVPAAWGRWVGILALFVAAAPVWAEKPPQNLRIATRIIPPFVFEHNDNLTGFSVDLWRDLSGELGAEYTMTPYPNVVELLKAVKSGKADVGIAAVSITADREKEVDFSQPMFDSGLQILVREQSGGGTSSILPLLFSPALLQVLGIILVMTLVPAHIIWLVERRHPDGLIENRAYFPGIFKACWWAAGTLATQADEMPKSAPGRLVAIFCMFGGVIFLAYFTAALTSSLTVQQLQGNIKGPDDLPGKRVATTRGSTSAAYLRAKKSQVQEFTTIDDAYDALLNAKADAVVFDAPILLYYSAHEGKGKVQVVGAVFRKESYGIVVPAGSPYRKQINHALLSLKESGRYQQLYDKWFGEGETGP
jgi:polar amino acid transport system substrate-binding protein